MIEFLDSSLVKWIGLISSLITISSVYIVKKRRAKVKNELIDTEVGGNFTGYKSSGGTKSESTVKNIVKGSKIKGNFTGSEEK